MAEVEVGRVNKFFGKVSVAAVEVTQGTIKVGDQLHFKGATTDFTIQVDSMQIDRVPVEEAKPGDLVGIKVPERVRPGDRVYQVEGED
ncbi:MAG: translation elongation factor-like protein [Aquificota bacterium]|nr:MAG: translation elongation factor-like protein [Aquificota bacterium]